jgi:signal transduction histidine kinase/ligand-binding sensor domain-containing protein
MRFFLIIAILFFISSFPALGQKNYFFTPITTHEGLSNNAVRSILQDSLGYIWIATSDGLNRYDGHRFKIFRHLDADGTSLPGNAVESLCLDDKGNLWCGGNGWNCVAMLPKGELKFKRYPFVGNSNASETRDITYDALGRIWVGTSSGIYLIDNSSNEAIDISTIQDSNNIPLGKTIFGGNSLHTEPETKSVWFLTNQGINFWDSSTNSFFNQKHNPSNDTIFNIKGCRSMTLDNNGVLWTGSTFGRDYWTWFGYDTHKKEIVYSSIAAPTDSHIQKNHFHSVTCSPDNQIWLGNNGRKPLIFDAISHHFDTTLARVYPGSLGNQTLRATCFDRDGNIWVGTEQGVYLATKERQKVNSQWLGDVSKFQKPRIKSILPFDSNEIWIAANRCIFRWFPDQQKLDTLWPIFNGNTLQEDVRYISRKNEHEIWLATFYGLYSYDQSRNQWTDELLELPEKWVERLKINSLIQHVFTDKNGYNYICTFGGLYVYNPSRQYYQFHSPKNSIQSITKINDYEARREGGYWFCGSDERELFYVKELPDSLYRFPIPSSSSFIISNIYEDVNNDLWLGSAHNGILRLNKGGNIVKQYSLNDGLHSNCVYKILESKYGNIIVITSNGLAQYDPKTDRFIRIFSSYTLSDYVHRDVGCIDLLGRIWSFSENIFYSIVPEEISAENEKPVTITGVKILNTEIGNSEMHLLQELNHYENTVTFDFSVFGFNPEVETRYEYQVPEISPEWIALQGKSTISFTGLPHGNYTFRVRSDQADKNKFTEVKFKIHPPWYSTLTFRLGLIAVIFSGIILLVKFYTRQKLRNKEQEFEKIRMVEKERMRIARDMHDDLGAGLTTIRMMSENMGKQKSDPELLEISGTAVDLVDRMRQIVWTLNEEQNKLSDLLYYLVAHSREFLRKNKISFSCDSVPECEIILSSVIRRNVFLATKEILNNTVKHAHANHVNMEFRLSENQITIIIRDDGTGISQEMGNKYGNGLKNIRRRMDEIGGNVQWKNTPGLEVSMTVFWN